MWKLTYINENQTHEAKHRLKFERTDDEYETVIKNFEQL